MEFIKNNKLVFVIMILCFIGLTGCEEGDGDADYGNAYIYMPQATSSGGLNNHYLIPGGTGINTYNFKEEGDKVNIYLGVLRSGKISNASGFTVDVAVSQAQTEEIVASGIISDALVLPSHLYELPNKVTVESGKDSASFFLSLDFEALSNYIYFGKKFVLVVGISNPTHYELSDQNTSVVVVIDVDAMLDKLSSSTQ